MPAGSGRDQATGVGMSRQSTRRAHQLSKPEARAASSSPQVVRAGRAGLEAPGQEAITVITNRDNIDALLRELDRRTARIRNEPGLSGEDKDRLVEAVRVRARVQLGEWAGLEGVDQVKLAQALVRVTELSWRDRLG